MYESIKGIISAIAFVKAFVSTSAHTALLPQSVSAGIYSRVEPILAGYGNIIRRLGSRINSQVQRCPSSCAWVSGHDQSTHHLPPPLMPPWVGGAQSLPCFEVRLQWPQRPRPSLCSSCPRSPSRLRRGPPRRPLRGRHHVLRRVWQPSLRPWPPLRASCCASWSSRPRSQVSMP